MGNFQKSTKEILLAFVGKVAVEWGRSIPNLEVRQTSVKSGHQVEVDILTVRDVD